MSEALSEYFSRSPEVRGHVLTDAGGLRKHMAIFVDGVRVEDDRELRDGGKFFEVLGEGLPQIHAYDLTLQYALDIDETGNALAFETTTGSLFISEDRGDRWECVSIHLPPVYCVALAPMR